MLLCLFFIYFLSFFFFFSSRRRHTRLQGDWSSDVCSSDLLDRTTIRAPVDGIVVKKSVEPGQTVAASLQAPELFVIAQDLRRMQVDTSVDEAEVGRIREGQEATFTVDSFPGRMFRGQVAQVRRAATVVQNVVTYTAVVGTSNPNLELF